MEAAVAEAAAQDARDWPYEFKVVSLNRLIVDEEYQRPLTTFVDKIVNNFDPALVGTLIVSGRQHGKYAVVDGQTRMEAMRELGMNEAPCLVYVGLTKGQEASLFARLQKERRGIHSYHRFRAALVAEEPQAVAVEQITSDCGYTIGVEKGEVAAVAALEYAYKRDAEVLERVLLVFRTAWGDEEDFVPTGDLIRGCAYLISKKPSIDDERLADRLSAVTPEQIRRRASALREGIGQGGGGNVSHMATAIEAIYRKKKQV